MKYLLCIALAVGASWLAFAAGAPDESKQIQKMNLGAFSVSLTVKDIAASHAFYLKLGFHEVMGKESQHWLIMRSGETTIGLFQGVFERNVMTFNPGWTSQNEPLKDFEDVRSIQRRLKAQGIIPVTAADETTTGPASFIIVDPDGNPIVFDQHVK
jgi:lactoylglutathione lyase